MKKLSRFRVDMDLLIIIIIEFRILSEKLDLTVIVTSDHNWSIMVAIDTALTGTSNCVLLHQREGTTG